MSFIEIYNVESMGGESGTSLSTLINTLSVIIASATAIYGINSWRREARWKKSTEIVEELTALLYELKDVVREIRSPASYTGEGDTHKDKNSKFQQLAIVKERFSNNKETFAKIQSKRYRAMAILGKSLEVHFKKVNDTIYEIFIAARKLDTHYWPKLGRDEEKEDPNFDTFLTELHKNEDIIWWSGEDDEYEKRIDNIINEFIEACNKLGNPKFLK